MEVAFLTRESGHMQLFKPDLSMHILLWPGMQLTVAEFAAYERWQLFQQLMQSLPQSHIPTHINAQHPCSLTHVPSLAGDIEAVR